MSTPPYLELPPGTSAVRLHTDRGELAALVAVPSAGVTIRSTALLVPGFTGSKEDFIGVLPALAARGHRVVALDQRGQHETGGPDDPAVYAVDELAADVLAAIAAIGDGPVHLLGHSFGGLVARVATLRDPTAVRTLTSLCFGPAALNSGEADRLRLLLQALTAVELPAIWDAIKALEAENGIPQPTDPAIAEFLRTRFLGNVAACLTVTGQQMLREPDRSDELAALGLPVLVAYGVDDYVWLPAEQAAMAKRIGARYVAIEGAAHSPAAEAPEATAGILADFWAEVDRSA